MIEEILKCRKCNLYKNQLPLLDKCIKCDVMWVGLSAKKVKCIENDYPLQEDTNSGKIIKEIEEYNKNLNYYKTNLVKCFPINKNNKIRYPSNDEMQICIINLLKEIDVLRPKIIFLLGNKVANFFNKYIKENNIIINSKIEIVPHPSYIYIYKKKTKGDYIKTILDRIDIVCKE